MPARRNLSLYRIKNHIASFDEVIVNHSLLDVIDLEGQYEFEAKLYVSSSKPRDPEWAEFLRPGFGRIPRLGKTVVNAAVLVLRAKYYKDRLFAFTFGQGRHLLRDETIVRNYGLRVVLNAVSKGEETANSDFVRLRSVDSKTLAPNPLRVRQQAAHKAPIELFEVDTFHDILSAATGLPVEADKWGGRISGATALHVSIELPFHELGKLCRLAERTFLGNAYRERYGWIDNIAPVADPAICEQLDDEVLRRLRSGKIVGLELGAPDLVEWSDVNHICYSPDASQHFADFGLSDYLSVLVNSSKLAGLTTKHLRSLHRVKVRDADGEDLHNWPVLRCLTGELTLNGKQYLISDGTYFEVAASYLSALNNFVRKIDKCDLKLPVAKGNDEGSYNVAAGALPNLLCLDQKLVQIASRSTPVEACDLLSAGGHLIHVKRKYGSSALSQLFAQGAVSAELIASAPEFRAALQKVVREAEEKRCDIEGTDDYRERFARFDDASFKAGAHEVVFAVIGSWTKATLPEWMPFFSKVNLRRHVMDLQRLGVKVTLASVDVV